MCLKDAGSGQVRGLYLCASESLAEEWTRPSQPRTADFSPAAVRRTLRTFVREHGQPQFVVLHESARAAALATCRQDLQALLIVFERPALSPGADVARALSGGPLPSDRFFLLLGARDRNGRALDEMDCYDKWSAVSRCWLWAADGSAEQRIAAVAQAWAVVTATPPPGAATLPGSSLGVDWVGVREMENLQQTIRAKTLFRHYGIGQPHQCEDLERTLRSRFSVTHSLAVSSGSAALNCAMAALGLGPGDEVILPAFSWYSCYNAILLCGATPVFAEIDGSLNLDPDDFRRRITPRTRAVIVVHYQGGPARMDAILEVARTHDLRVIEDCAQAIGASNHGRPLGSLGDIGTVSFQSNKIISCGEGGALLCRDRRLFERAVRHHDLGMIRPTFQRQSGGPSVTAPFPGNQYRMSELAAAVATAQISRLDWILERCRIRSQRLRSLLVKACPGIAFRSTGDDRGDAGITLFVDWLIPARARAAAKLLNKQNIWPGPSSGMTNLLEVDYVRSRTGPRGSVIPGQPFPTLEDFPRTADWVGRCLPFAVSPRFRPDDIKRLADAIARVHGNLFRENPG